MSDYNLPILTSTYTDFLDFLKSRDVDAITLCLANPSNAPVGTMKWNRATTVFQEWSGAAFADVILNIAGGGTGAATAAGARTSLGLGSMATQNSNAVNITGGTITNGVAIAADGLATGVVPQARLGSGSGGAGNLFLADNQTYKQPVPAGSGFIWYTNIAPAGYLLCDGSAVSRATYAALFGVIGTTYGVGDGSTTFNLPDLRQRFPIGKAAAGTANTLAGTGGAIDHTHTSASHTHSIAAHHHDGSTITMGFGTDQVNVQHATVPDTGVATNVHVHFLTGNTGDTAQNTDATVPGATGTNNPPYLVINYIIKT